MAIIKFVQRSPSGNATVDSSQVLIGVDGTIYVYTGPSSDNRIVPLEPERCAALEQHFGGVLRDAIDAVTALD